MECGIDLINCSLSYSVILIDLSIKSIKSLRPFHASFNYRFEMARITFTMILSYYEAFIMT